MRTRAAQRGLRVFAGGDAQHFVSRHLERRQLLLHLLPAVGAGIAVDHHDFIHPRPLHRLPGGGVVQALIPRQQQRIGHHRFQRLIGGLAAAEDKVFIEGILAVGDAQNGALTRQLQGIDGEIIGKRLLFAEVAVIIVTVFFQVVTVIRKGAVENMLLAEGVRFKDAVDMAVPDGDPIGAGNQRTVALHHADGVRQLIRRIKIIVIHADNVFPARQFIKHIAFFAQRQPLRMMDIADIKARRIVVRQGVNNGDLAGVGVIENDQLTPIRRVILVAEHIQQIRQKRGAVPGWRHHADKR